MSLELEGLANPQRSKRSRVFLWVVYLSIGFATAGVVLMIFWLVRPYDGLTFSDDPTVVGPATVSVGDPFTWTRTEVCRGPYPILTQRWAERYSEYDGYIVSRIQLPSLETPIPHATLNDENGFRLDPGKLECAAPFSTTIYIPSYLPPGVYRIQSLSAYEPNPVRKIVVESRSPLFEVVDNDSDPSEGVKHG